MKSYIKFLPVIYLLVLTTFALLSGNAEGFFDNLPNTLPWILGWLSLIIVWKYQKLGGVLFLLLGIASVFFFHTYLDFIPFLIVSFPLILFGLLFLFSKSDNNKTKFRVGINH